ncbi:MAG: WecB/TagA/CpsF family glycosyltransferase [Burkholderiales bacterium]|nr:WecB/TagA/CpsF family glycosyltransferase [Burkholderiales bacterium]
MSDGLEAPRSWQQRWVLLVKKIELVQTVAQELQLLTRLSHPDKPFVLAFANAHAMNFTAESAPFFSALHSADIVLRDGVGMATLFKLLGQSPGLNLNGTDLIPQVVRRFNGRSIAIFGTRDPYLEQGLQVIAREFAPQSSYVRAHGFLDIAAYATLSVTHQPELIVLGMGMPRQEEVAAALRSALTHPCLIVCGGAIIDFLAGKTPRAPWYMRRIGMEWIFRLAMEPRRLFRRYVIGNPLFLAKALLFALSITFIP